MATLKINSTLNILLYRLITLASSCVHQSISFFNASPQIREELQANDIDVYPQKEFDEDAEDRAINERIRVSWGVQSASPPFPYFLTFLS